MAQEPARRELDAIIRRLFEPLLRGDPNGSWRVLGWDAEQGLTLTVEHRGNAILIEFEDRDEERPCYGRTGRFNVTARLLFHRDQPMSPEDHRLVEGIIELVGRRETELPEPARVVTARKAQLREILVERMLIQEGENQYYLNPYAGCTIGCAFCYVADRADLSRRLEGLPRYEWGRWVDVKVNAAEVLRKEVETLPPGVVRMSPILTDPYQPAEAKYHVTRQCLEVLRGRGFVPVVLTRAPRILDDLDLLASFETAAVGFSIPTDDDAVRRLFEPGADPVEERFEALRACHEAGLETFGVIQPMLPMDPATMVERMAPWVKAVRIDRMHQMEQARPLYEKAELLRAAEPGFFDRTYDELVRGFRAHGVAHDELDDLGGLLGLRTASGTRSPPASDAPA